MNTIREYRERGGLVAAVFPIHYPRELLRAFNVLPVEVWGPPRVRGNYGEAHLQSYVCSIVRNALSFLQSGGLNVVDLLLVPHACDSLQGLGSILIDFISPTQPLLTLYLPRGTRASDFIFLADEFRTIYQRLKTLVGCSPSEADLMASIYREEIADGLLCELHLQRQNLPLDDESFYRFIRSREYVPAERFTAIAQDLLSRAVEIRQGGVPIIISGIVPEPMSLFGSLSELGGCVVADDLACCGRRLYPAGQSEDPFQRMAERILHGPPDSTRGSPICERLDHLLHLVDVSGAKGVVFYDVKFCEPELFDIPLLRQGLRKAGILSLAVEVEIGDELSQPVLNRLAAFFEMIQ
jgi:benzoyl-CoA reductase/2-hydroxyglutaryl-CoA dehydratase subunit BcrC/BadD/HgdB